MENTLVKVPYGGRALFFRVLAVDLARNAVRGRLERFTMFWQTTDIEIKKGALLDVCRVRSNKVSWNGDNWLTVKNVGLMGWARSNISCSFPYVQILVATSALDDAG